MRSRWVFSISLTLLACAESEAEPAGVGEPCEQSTDCEASLSCVEGLCESDREPLLDLWWPEQLDVYDPGDEALSVQFTLLEHEADDRVELIVDPGTADETTVETSLDAPVRADIYFLVDIPRPPSGPHRIRARLVDAEGQPYGGWAEDSAVFFVRDALEPSTPQVAIVAPEPSTSIEAGAESIEVEVAVLPGSFAFTAFGGDECKPVSDCSPAFAPECEDSCGPVSRFGHAKLYVEPEFPDCLSGATGGCWISYIAGLGPGPGVELVDAFVARTMLPVELLGGPGEVQLSAGLSYPSHGVYPNAPEVVHHTITIDVGG